VSLADYRGKTPVLLAMMRGRDWDDRERYRGQRVGQFLLDRHGVVRLVNIEDATEGLAGMGKSHRVIAALHLDEPGAGDALGEVAADRSRSDGVGGWETSRRSSAKSRSFSRAHATRARQTVSLRRS
jgi:hypothetical protein